MRWDTSSSYLLRQPCSRYAKRGKFNRNVIIINNFFPRLALSSFLPRTRRVIKMRYSGSAFGDHIDTSRSSFSRTAAHQQTHAHIVGNFLFRLFSPIFISSSFSNLYEITERTLLIGLNISRVDRTCDKSWDAAVQMQRKRCEEDVSAITTG